MEQERQTKGIWIPIGIWKDKKLSWNEKILLLEIDSYTSQDRDCFFSNEYISELLGISQTSANKVLSSLISKGYVIKTRFDGRRRYVKAALPFTTTLPCQERQPSRARVYNNTDNNIHNNLINKSNKNKEKDSTTVLYEKKEKEKPNWREDYEVYKSLIDDALRELFADEEYKRQIENLFPNIDYKRTLIACSLYWKDAEQYETYKRKRIQQPRFTSALKKGIHINKVYKPRGSYADYGYPLSVEDVKEDDVQDSLVYFNYWIEKAAPKVCDGIIGGRPQTQQQYQSMIDHTIGGARALCYVVLVFNRDGWAEYYDERGFMHTYANYIKANGLYKD